MLNAYEHEITALSASPETNIRAHDGYYSACTCEVFVAGTVKAYLDLFSTNFAFLNDLLMNDIMAQPNKPGRDIAQVHIADIFCRYSFMNLFLQLDPWLLWRSGVQGMHNLIESCSDCYCIVKSLLYLAPEKYDLYVNGFPQHAVTRDAHFHAFKWADFMFCQKQDQKPMCVCAFCRTCDKTYDIHKIWCKVVDTKKQRVAAILADFLPADVCRFVILPFCSL